MPNPEALRVSELAADWRNRVRLIFGQGPTGIAMLKCAAELESALSEVGGEAEKIVRSHRRHVEQSPGVGADVQKYALAVLDDVLDDLSIATPAPPVGADWVMVPREPTPEIIYAIRWARSPEDLWEKCLAAAPTPAEARGVGDGVRALPEKWRDEAYNITGNVGPGSIESQIFQECAEQLEAALSASPAGRGDSDGAGTEGSK